MSNKDCPFCGGEVDAKGWRSDTEQGPECEDCGATARSLKRWNTRIPAAEDRAIFIAITELESVEREIGVPSKALPLLRAALGKTGSNNE